MWYRINLAYATFGIKVDDNFKVIKTAPIGKWMMGKDISYIQMWVYKKGGKIEQLKMSL